MDGTRPPSYSWVMKYAGVLRSLDWVSRHDYFSRLSRSHPYLSSQLLRYLCPDEHLCGTFTSVRPLQGCALPVRDRKKSAKQALITDFFKPKQPTKPLRMVKHVIRSGYLAKHFHVKNT